MHPSPVETLMEQFWKYIPWNNQIYSFTILLESLNRLALEIYIQDLLVIVYNVFKEIYIKMNYLIFMGVGI